MDVQIKQRFPDEDRYLIKILLAVSKKAITRKWNKENPPTLENWMEIVDEICVIERLTYNIRLQQTKWETRWVKWTTFKSHKDS